MPDHFRKFQCRFLIVLLFLIIFSQAFTLSGQEQVDADTVIAEITVEENDEYYFDSMLQTGPALTVRELPDSVYENLRRDKDYWYVNMPPPRKEKTVEEKKEYKEGWMESKTLRNFVLVLIILVFIGAIIWFLASSNIKLFHTPKKLVEDENAVITEEDLFNINYENEIRNAKLSGNYRLAIRLWYLRTLKELTEKNLIGYGHEKTNTQYLDELYETRYYKDFSRLTRNFEFAWYGKFELQEDTYKVVEKEFAEFNRYLK